MKAFSVLLVALVAIYVEANHGSEKIHLAESEPYKGKVFLLPWGKDNRKGDWLYNYGLCQSVGAEMVTIHSDKENMAFINFLRQFGLPPGIFLGTPGVWLGGRFGLTTKVSGGGERPRDFTWANGEDNGFNKLRHSEPDDNGLSCLNVLSKLEEVEHPNWYSYPCTEMGFYCACQKRLSDPSPGKAKGKQEDA